MYKIYDIVVAGDRTEIYINEVLSLLNAYKIPFDTIGKIPKTWKVVRLQEISELIMGQSPPSSTYNKTGRGLPFLQGKMEFGDSYPSPVMYCSNPLKIAETNDVLISVRAPVGDVNLAPYKVCIGRGLAAIRFNAQIANYLFYFYYLQKIKGFIETLGKGAAAHQDEGFIARGRDAQPDANGRLDHVVAWIGGLPPISGSPRNHFLLLVLAKTNSSPKSRCVISS